MRIVLLLLLLLLISVSVLVNRFHSSFGITPFTGQNCCFSNVCCEEQKWAVHWKVRGKRWASGLQVRIGKKGGKNFGRQEKGKREDMDKTLTWNRFSSCFKHFKKLKTVNISNLFLHPHFCSSQQHQQLFQWVAAVWRLNTACVCWCFPDVGSHVKARQGMFFVTITPVHSKLWHPLTLTEHLSSVCLPSGQKRRLIVYNMQLTASSSSLPSFEHYSSRQKIGKEQKKEKRPEDSHLLIFSISEWFVDVYLE